MAPGGLLIREGEEAVLQRLQERGLIELTRGRIVVRDRAALAARLR